MSVGVIIPAGGFGRRMGSKIEKQFLKIGGASILDRCLSVFNKHPKIDEIVVVLPQKRVATLSSRLKEKFRKVSAVVAGGKERTHSVHNGFRALKKLHSIILVHDSVRPFVTLQTISDTIKACSKYDGVTVAVRAKDTIKKIKGTKIMDTLDRRELWQIQTPQGFKRKVLDHALQWAFRKNITGTDDCLLAEKLGRNVHVVEGNYTNIKITTKEDLVFARAIVESGQR